MKLRSILGIAAASAFAWSAGASAAWFGHGNGDGNHRFWFFHGQHAASSMWNGYEVQTPSQVDESAPWKANEPHMPGPIESRTSATTYSSNLGDVSYGTGASSSASGYGSGGFTSSRVASSDMSHFDNMSFASTVGRPYWMLDD